MAAGEGAFHLKLCKLLPCVSLGDKSWKQLTACLNFAIFFSMDRKRIQTPRRNVAVYSGISDQTKPLQLIGRATEFKFEFKFEPLLVIWQSIPSPEDFSRSQSKPVVLQQNQSPSSFGRAAAAMWHNLGH